MFFLAPLLILSPQLIAESIARSAVLEVGIDRAASQTAEGITVATRGVGDVAVLAGKGSVGGGVELDAVVLAGTAKDAAGLAAGVAVAGAAHDVAELDATGLAVPEAAADEEQDDGAKDGGQGDDEGLAVGRRVRVVGQRGLLEQQGQRGGGGALGAAVDVLVEGHGDVVLRVALEVGRVDVKGPVSPAGRHAVKRLELLELLGGAVPPVDAGGHLPGGVVVGGVEVVGIPGDLRLLLADCTHFSSIN